MCKLRRAFGSDSIGFLADQPLQQAAESKVQTAAPTTRSTLDHHERTLAKAMGGNRVCGKPPLPAVEQSASLCRQPRMLGTHRIARFEHVSGEG